MTGVLNRLLKAAVICGGSLMAVGPALAVDPPTPISVDGGPLGPLSLSGAGDGLFFGQTGASNNSVSGDRSTGASFGAAQVNLKSTGGLVQFNILAGAYGGVPALGTGFGRANLQMYRDSPIKNAYVTLAPLDTGLTISAGQLPSLEGYEAGPDFGNDNIFFTSQWYVQNSSSPGVSVGYTKGAASATVTFGDGWNTYVFNFLQALLQYQFDSNNNINGYYAGNLSHTGLNALTFGECGDERCTVNTYGSNFINSQLFGGWYTHTAGNVKITSQVQYVYSKADRDVGIDSYTANFGAYVLMDYKFDNSPYSLGGMVEYFDSVGPSFWFIGPRAEGVGLELTPTWQSKDKHLYVRMSAGVLHLLNSPGAGYGDAGTGRNVLQAAVEAGIMF
jgi:hypothetical protein